MAASFTIALSLAAPAAADSDASDPSHEMRIVVTIPGRTVPTPEPTEPAPTEEPSPTPSGDVDGDDLPTPTPTSPGEPTDPAPDNGDGNVDGGTIPTEPDSGAGGANGAGGAGGSGIGAGALPTTGADVIGATGLMGLLLATGAAAVLWHRRLMLIIRR